MVDDVLVNWEAMEGPTWLHKQVNALLTAMFIVRHDVPADECLSEATVALGLQGMVEAGEWELRVLWFLKERFATFSRADDREDKKVFPHFEALCDRVAPLVFLLCEQIEPVDLPMFLVSNGFDLTGGVAERSMAPDLKSDEGDTSGGSNPPSSANT